ncbi:hypothetical protein MRB53_020723 [Persea americana]|uniref:Uncharacterized protein n=1 Tax=Persea americana TaxID=3435 RepID=A0ACC2L1K2_PERAE|nr:hypothetical protein MRB53_020723 [Persea americana]
MGPRFSFPPFIFGTFHFPLSSSCDFSDLVELNLSHYRWTSIDVIEVLSRSRRASLSLIALPLSSISLLRRLSRWSSANVISLFNHRSLLDISLIAAVSAGCRLPRCSLPHVISLSAALQ